MRKEVTAPSELLLLLRVLRHTGICIVAIMVVLILVSSSSRRVQSPHFLWGVVATASADTWQSTWQRRKAFGASGSLAFVATETGARLQQSTRRGGPSLSLSGTTLFLATPPPPGRNRGMLKREDYYSLFEDDQSRSFSSFTSGRDSDNDNQDRSMPPGVLDGTYLGTDDDEQQDLELAIRNYRENENDENDEETTTAMESQELGDDDENDDTATTPATPPKSPFDDILMPPRKNGAAADSNKRMFVTWDNDDDDDYQDFEFAKDDDVYGSKRGGEWDQNDDDDDDDDYGGGGDETDPWQNVAASRQARTTSTSPTTRPSTAVSADTEQPQQQPRATSLDPFEVVRLENELQQHQFSDLIVDNIDGESYEQVDPAAKTSQPKQQRQPQPPPMVSTPIPAQPRASSGITTTATTTTRTSTSMEELQATLDSVKEQIYQQNNGREFNINSPKQVAQVLFGTTTSGSTNKDVLDSMASAGNRMADLILQYRRAKATLQKQQKKQDLARQGRQVQSVTNVARPTAKAPTAPPPTSPVTVDDVASSSTPEQQKQQSTPATQPSEVATDPLLLVDASALIFRAYHAMPPMHRNSDGMPTSAVLGFCNTLNRLLIPSPSSALVTTPQPSPLEDGFQENGNDSSDDSDEQNDSLMPRIVLVFDAKNVPTFRHELYPEYKSNRPSVPFDLIPQFDLVREAAAAYGICQVEAPGYEADDVIATLATWATCRNDTGTLPIDTNILSADKDLMQLVTDDTVVPSVHMIDPMTMARTTFQEVLDKWHVPPDRLGDLLALAGDSADNIPGVKGIGPKTASQLLLQFDSLDEMLDHVDDDESLKTTKRIRNLLRDHADTARISRQLVTLEHNVTFDKLVITTAPPATETAGGGKQAQTNIDSFGSLIRQFRMETIDVDRVMQFYDAMGFKTIKRTFRNGMNILHQQQEQHERRKASRQRKRRPKAQVPKPEEYSDVPF